MRGVGAWCQLPSPLAAEILAAAGYDWVGVDMQHGQTGLETMAQMVQSVSVGGAAPLVRVPANEAWLVGRALDAGASGVIVPLVSTAEEAERAARACRYAPGGTRSFGPVRMPGAEPVACIVMVETRQGVENAAAICSVPGVDGIYVGPWDLALSHGHEAPGPETEPALERILAACREAGVPAGIHAGSGEAARAYLERGFSFVGVASDLDFLAATGRRELEAALGGAPGRASQAGGLVRVPR